MYVINSKMSIQILDPLFFGYLYENGCLLYYNKYVYNVYDENMYTVFSMKIIMYTVFSMKIGHGIMDTA